MFTVTYVHRELQPNTKRIVCYGFEFIVPEDIKYVAVDNDGSIMGYRIKPVHTQGGVGGYWYSDWHGGEEGFEMGTVRFDGDWKESLIEV